MKATHHYFEVVSDKIILFVFRLLYALAWLIPMAVIFVLGAWVIYRVMWYLNNLHLIVN